MMPPEAPPLTADPSFPLGASGTMKNARSLVWEMSFSIPVPLGCPAFHVTHGWTPISGLGQLSGRGSKRPCPQLTGKAVCAGATGSDRPPALGVDCRAAGTQGEDGPQ